MYLLYCIKCDIEFLPLERNTRTHTHTQSVYDLLVHQGKMEKRQQRETEREKPHISLMPFSKYRSKSHTSSRPRGGAQDEFSPCLLTPPHMNTHTSNPPSARLFYYVSERKRERLWVELSNVGNSSTVLLKPPVFIPAWALDVITAQRSTLTETESSQRQQAGVRDIESESEREMEREVKKKKSTTCSRSALLLQWYKSAPCCFWCLDVKHTFTHLHVVFEILEKECIEPARKERLCVFEIWLVFSIFTAWCVCVGVCMHVCVSVTQ